MKTQEKLWLYKSIISRDPRNDGRFYLDVKALKSPKAYLKKSRFGLKILISAPSELAFLHASCKDNLMSYRVLSSILCLALLGISCKKPQREQNESSARGKSGADANQETAIQPIPNIGASPNPVQPQSTAVLPSIDGTALPASIPVVPAPQVVTPVDLEVDTKPLSQATVLRFPIANGKNLAYVSNRDITKAAQTIETVVFIVHGIDRNPAVYYNSIQAAVLAHPGPNSLSAKTWVIAPFFMQAEDSPLASDMIWSGGNWKEGNAAQGFNDISMSSYAALDTIVKALDNPARFSKLKTVVLVGFSAGGQFMQRFLLGTKLTEQLTGLKFRFVVGSPGSYMYITPDRMKANGAAGFALPNVSSCLDYDDYRYGLKNRVPYLLASTGADMLARLKTRDIRFIAGDADTSRGGVLDVTCAGDLQGENRFARSQKFVEYSHFLGAGNNIKAFVAPNAAHDHTKVFSTSQGQSALFDP